MLTQERAKELLKYDPETGVFTWNAKRQGVRSGDIAGCTLSIGYIYIKLDRVSHPSHRIAWLIYHGKFPDNQIDHINGIRNDNRIVNLRDVTRVENSKNQKRSSNNSSGITGVSWDKSSNRWRAQITSFGVNINLGCFIDINEASEARANAEKEYNFHPNHGRAV